MHVYNATAPVFRDVVFGVDRAGCIEIATQAPGEIKALMQANPQTHWTYQYSPETFCFTELDFGLEICEAVIDVFEPSPTNKMILNLPITVEVSTANVLGDQRLSGSPKNICIRDLNHRSAGSLSCAPRQAMCSSKVRTSKGRSSARRPPAAVSASAV